ncbi:hypothetical protein SAMN05216456_1330 [Devosia crocina]|uniref:DUF2806 domain-containing protein n=1 Tax=Devosia crocina TaxID=429728 RepID=A0A1I7N9Q5_9HYPH|nr:hypothetical protein [Devosia crocina]SFV31404.1 hypothetical protein SAMN05216456_1330 [Devosia crocina]
MSEESGNSKSLISFNDVFGLGKVASSPAAAEVVKGITAGIYALYEPAHQYLLTRTVGAAKRAVAVKDAEAASKIASLYRNNPEIAEATQARILGLEFVRTERIAEAAARATHYANAVDDEQDVHPIHPDYAIEWMESVKDVSDDALVDIFAKLLANATQQKSGRVPKPVQDLVRRMDATGANLFVHVMRCATVVRPAPFAAVIASAGVDDVESQLGLLRDIGAIEFAASMNFRLPFLNADVSRAMSPDYQLPPSTIQLTETGRLLHNYLMPTTTGVGDTSLLFETPDLWFSTDGVFELRFDGFSIPVLPKTEPMRKPLFDDLPVQSDHRLFPLLSVWQQEGRLGQPTKTQPSS